MSSTSSSKEPKRMSSTTSHQGTSALSDMATSTSATFKPWTRCTTSLSTAKSAWEGLEPAKCDTAGPTGRNTAERLERVTLVQAIVAEGDQLERQRAQEIYYSASTLRHATLEELKLICNRHGIDADLYEKKGIIVELLNLQTEQRAMRLDARKLMVEQAHERIGHMTERLRELMPPGVRIGDYLKDHRNESTKRKRPRPAARIY